jgi:hypothetical protein
MLRECPLEEHVCMTGIDVARVRMEVLRLLGSGPKPPVRHGGVEGNDE